GISVRVQAGGGQPDQDVPGAHTAAVEDRISVHDAHDEARDVVLPCSIEAGHLRRLAAQQGAARFAAAARDSVHHRGQDLRVELAGREVVHEEQRRGALYQDVVDAVIDEIAPDTVVDTGFECDAQLG